MHLFYATRYKVVYWRKLLYWATTPASLDSDHTQGSSSSNSACNERLFTPFYAKSVHRNEIDMHCDMI